MATGATIRRKLIPIAIFVFWAVVLIACWTLPLLTRPAQTGAKVTTSKTSKSSGGGDQKDKQSKEGFASGPFPEILDTTLLAGTYQEPEKQSLGPYTATEAAKNYPIFPAGACGTNNLRYWKRPSNGTAPWPELEGAFYKATKQQYPPPPKPPVWDAGIRVNFFESCLR